MTTMRMRLGGAAIAAAALLLAGCSSGNNEVNSGTSAAGTGAMSTSAAAPTSPTSPTGDAAAAATGATVPVAQSGGSGSTNGTPRCTAGELKVSLGQGDAGAGSVYRPLVFTNTGSRTCELTGFPGVSYVAGADGHQVGPAAQMSGPRGGEVRMAPGHTSVAQLQLVQVRNYDEAVCKPTPVRGLRVYPPGETASLFVPMDGEGCAGNPPGPQLTVKTITAQ
ncbi:DUF4232 domain-containing protein [Pseudonocardia acidicola]|uniref:DUF4232 domain-containing protein n=1 Tax=Pseudonocardia acidicola TaxID=2724939 RepID=A0ABX1S988_9PSEU|nr:DUF4232 domain-containing protein [Pseudonocardia acidicola]NMH98126.1 DUF4232 domain-containing protein [Pseudonocardia acidicola]